MKMFIRRIIQWACLAGLTLLFVRQDYAQAPRPFFTWIGWLDPLTGITAVIQRQWPWLILLSVASVALAFWRKRFFCGWICPVGAVLDLSGDLKHKILKDGQPGKKFQAFLTVFRWAFLGAAVSLTVLGNGILLSFDPMSLWPREVTRISQHLWPWSLLAVVAMGLILFPRFWCRYLCPTGSVLSIFGRLGGRPFEANDACRRCGLCVKRCPNRNISADIKFGADCLDCGMCQKICPQKSIDRPKRLTVPVDEDRRDLLVGAGIGAGLLAVGALTRMHRSAESASPRWKRHLRPPGALREDALALTCDRCEQCINVCPTKALVPSGLEAGLAAFATPRFVPRRGRCMQCMACGQVCPTGALVPVQPQETRLGTAKIDHENCIVWAKHIRCLLCVEVCPTFAIGIDKQGRPVIDESKCIGCGACENNCPVKGAAVRVYNIGEKRR